MSYKALIRCSKHQLETHGSGLRKSCKLKLSKEIIKQKRQGMQFTTRFPIDQCRDFLWQHDAPNALFANTEIEIHPMKGDHSEFAIRRIWKGLHGLLRYSVMEAQGTLTSKGYDGTKVEVYLRMKGMGYFVIGTAIFVFLLALAGSYGLGWILGFALLILLIYDRHVLNEAIKSLRP
jgi:hypothetical protein